MVIDTSAIVAILFGEPEADDFAKLIQSASTRLVSAVTRVELTFVVEGRKRDEGRSDLERLFQHGNFDVVDLSAHQAAIASEAFRHYGKGRHPAQLNIGDVFAYALAKATDQPLLFKGNDFSQTDVRSALPPAF